MHRFNAKTDRLVAKLYREELKLVVAVDLSQVLISLVSLVPIKSADFFDLKD